MDTQVDVPQFKLAKIGGKRERKKGALPFGWGGGGSGAGFGAAGGGAAAAGMAGLAAKAAVALVLGVLGVGAYNVGKDLASQDRAVAEKQRLFASKESQSPEAGSGSFDAQASAGPSGLSMIAGSLDGKTPEQRAAEAAEAEAAAKAEAERQAQADAEAAKGAPEAGGPGGIDAAAMAAAAAGQAGEGAGDKKSGPFSSRFGALSNGLGGGNSGLAGGAGMAGGVGRAFDSATLGSSKGFGASKTPARTSARITKAVGRGRSKAFRQLDATNRQSRSGQQAPTLETAVTNADAPFSNNPGASNAITGGGAGTTGGAGAADSAGSPNTDSGGGGGGPTAGREGSNCFVGSTDPACAAPSTGHKDVTPWGKLVKMASALLLVAGILLIIAGILSYFGYTKTIAQILGGIAAMMGIIAAGLGAAIMKEGGGMQGMMFVVSGGIIAAAGALVAFKPPEGGIGQANMMGKIAIFSSMIGGLLGAGTGASGLSAKYN